MARYFRLLLAIARYHLVRTLEFNVDFFIGLAIHVFFVGTNLVFFSLLWGQVGGFGGLSPAQMLFFLGTLHVGDGLFMMFAFFGILHLPHVIRQGELDFVLVRPVSSQFLATMKVFSPLSAIDILLGLAMIAHAVRGGAATVGWAEAPLYLVLVVTGTAISYSLGTLVMSLAFIFLSVNGVWTLYFELGEAQRFPLGVYPRGWKLLFTVTLPVVLVANIPAHYALNLLGWGEALWFCTAAALLLYASHRAWQAGLRRYHSASS